MNNARAQVETEPQAQRLRRKRLLVGVWCLAHEKAALEANAQQTGLSVSAYLRNLGLGYTPKNTLELGLVAELSKVSADQGRLGGLLKMLLTNRERVRDPSELERLLRQIAQAQSQLLKIAERI